MKNAIIGLAKKIVPFTIVILFVVMFIWNVVSDVGILLG